MPETDVVTEPTTEPTKPPAFLDGIDEQYHSAVSAFKDLPNPKNSLAKGYSELFSKLGSYTKVPNDESPPEEVRAFYAKQGCPDTPDGYNPPKLPEGKEYDKEYLGSMSTAAHEVGITDKQWTKLITRHLDLENQKAELAKGERIRAEAEGDRVLKEKWGAEYPANTAIVQRACDELIEDPEVHDAFAELVAEKGLKNNPIFAQVFCSIGQKMLSDTFVKGAGQTEGEEYEPKFKNSPDMYAAGDGEESAKARDYFRKKGHVYARSD